MSERDPSALERDRRAGAMDRDWAYYERLRRRHARQRAKQERRDFDPSPPDDEDWTVPDEETDGVRRVRRPEAVSAAVESFIAQRGWGDRLRTETALARWDDIVGEELSAHCEPVRLVGGVLTVRTESPAWATQIRYLSMDIRERVEAELGAGTVQRVVISVGILEGIRRLPPAEAP